jgi:hypothetical protein
MALDADLFDADLATVAESVAKLWPREANDPIFPRENPSD